MRPSARRLTGMEDDAARRALRRKYPLLHGVLVPLGHRVGRRRTGRTVHFELLPTTGATDRADAPATTRLALPVAALTIAVPSVRFDGVDTTAYAAALAEARTFAG